jgi:hypothetical protein
VSSSVPRTHPWPRSPPRLWPRHVHITFLVLVCTGHLKHTGMATIVMLCKTKRPRTLPS